MSHLEHIEAIEKQIWSSGDPEGVTSEDGILSVVARKIFFLQKEPTGQVKLHQRDTPLYILQSVDLNENGTIDTEN